METAGLLVFSYFLGAVPVAYLAGRLVKGMDIRTYGSGNVGSSNVFQHVGKRWTIPVSLFEVLVKGASPIWIGQYVMGFERSSPVLLAAPLLALAGHNWSVFLRFQGGRGILLAAGALLALSPLLLGIAATIALSGWAWTRSSGVWVLASIVVLPFAAWLAGEPAMVGWYCTGLLTLVVVKRLISNWTPLPQGLPKRKVLFNRLLRDRDVDNREEWVRRMPGRSH